jgi:hypothetical protein
MPLARCSNTSDALPPTYPTQARLCQACGLGAGSVESLTFLGQAVAPGDDLRALGVSTGTGCPGLRGADEALYPNGWFASSLSKAYQKVGRRGGHPARRCWV